MIFRFAVPRGEGHEGNEYDDEQNHGDVSS
jgi:hypothetical protein